MRKSGQNTKLLVDCIAQGLLELMHEKDYASISISEICKRAGVGRTTFYRHFSKPGNKDDILVYYAASLWSDYCDVKKGLAEKDIWGTLMNFIYDNRNFFSSIGSAQLDHILFSIFYKTIGPEKEDNPEIAFIKSFLAGAVFGITYNWVESGFKNTPAKLAENLAKLQSEHLNP